MTAVAGASQYANASLLANTKKIASQSTNLISSFGAISLLDIGRGTAVRGTGISNNARFLNRQQLQNSATYNGLFSAGVSGAGTVDGLKTQINALRSALSERQVSRSLVGTQLDTSA